MPSLKIIALLLFLGATSSRVVVAVDPVTFNRDVRPILADKCFQCHGPDSATREADLRLDVEESAKQDRDGIVAVKPGDSQRSELVHRIMSTDADLQMPPVDSGRSLTDAQKQILIRWIESGAPWEGHWSFVAPTRAPLPQTENAAWSRNDIDQFVLQGLETAGLQPAAETEKTTWIRRVSFDLTGLPPTLAEVDAFLDDDTDEAHERVVDRLLSSSRYGEHMAATWLDAARYADTDGYQNDGPRTMFRWRDWVIDAFNDNMPFDQFTVDQLAGDLLPNASLSQNIATGFNRNHRYNSESGLVLKEFLLENAVDRVETVSTVWMGLTMGCARCHDHKYDPFGQREYYQLISFFDNIAESGRAIKFGNSEPWIVAPTNEQQTQLQKIDRQLADLRHDLKQAASAIQEEVHNFENLVQNSDIADLDLDRTLIVSRGLAHHFLFEDMEAEGVAVEVGQPVLREGLFGKSATVGGNGVLALGKVGDVACQTRSSISFWLKPEKLESGVVLSRQSPSTTRPGFTAELRDGHLQFYIITRWIAGVGAVETLTPLEADVWVHVTLTNDGSQRATGQQIWINGQQSGTRVLYNTNSNTGGTNKNGILRIGGGVHGDKFRGQVDELRFYKRTLFEDEILLLAERRTVPEILATAVNDRSDSERAKLIAWLAGRPPADGGTSKRNRRSLQLFEAIDQLRERRVKLLDSFPTTMVMMERSVSKRTHVRVRGVYDNYGDIVGSDTPGVFPAMPGDGPANRVGFAKWLVSGRHPLTARVIVNRYWQNFFGTGLVRTAGDFGLQGELPSHPELLDWLAVEFVESGWNVKALHKLIALSATYRQSSRQAPGDVDIDVDNRLLSRGPRQRLTARQLRDQALFVSGLMTTDIGGRSVSPYQPAKLWEEMSNMKYKQSTGKDLYRRGLYTIWKRTVAPPSLAILDAADRESCTVRPKRTNTPLQALTLLNETTFVEAARHLATRMMTEGKEQPVVFAFRCVTCRQPAKSELEGLRAARDSYVAEFKANPERAAELLKVGESPAGADLDQAQLAGNTMLCNVLLNLDEVLTKE
ncbi:MAG TPA: DUF1553 domain-containing protein [Fuerstia sp.]|nr:DUF1553 domain-containing protein [Fuerstiella sp.]